MRVQVHNSSDHSKPAPAEMSENGRARRKRVPKLCDCCGPNTKPHALGHGPVTKKRGRRKKEVANEVEVTTDNHLSSAFVDLASTPDTTDTTDTMTVCDMQQVTLPEPGPPLSGEQIIPLVLHNGTAASPENGPKTNSECNDADCTPLSDSKEPSSVTHSTTQASLDAHCDPTTPLDCMHGSLTSHSDCTEKCVGPAAESSITTSDQPTDTDAMEIEHAVYAVYLNTKALRDHRYCKRPHGDAEEEQANISQPPSAEIQQEDIVELLHEYLEFFYGKYGSFIPLSEEDILEYLNKHLNADFNDRGKMINKEVLKYKASLACASMHFFKVTYNKHTLALEDLSTLEDQNWVNDQVINMYGELIMDATNHKVHFFNSFFYKQLVAKGYEGVKRWTKKVDVFSKRLLLIPLHLEIHWSLITVDVPKQNINFYDSQGILFKFAVENILKYIIAEAKEKKHAALQKGWKMTVNKGIPQQKNDNDCGVFVLEYCKCLAFKGPLQFTQEDMPKVRKRIYKELCDCKLSDLQKQV
ncbi:LOW QUALITY PROTEIN: sentrin-specific protease 5 [Pangasianodon hypophthalmus]|uniref:LOW QUALITY PROTEIN: sentrin-specific protease 5 n=1 Tax=Pangasianodon hypophthalmus TaxID=310915 RepID=UPI002306ED7F|nr:LOW QUALITY PROTEIN: sentrin-specific protease 5 [Pangasianodon hypophthalmus]